MFKRHSLISVAVAILTLVILQAFIQPLPVFRFLVPLRILWLIIVAGYNYWYLKNSGKFNSWIWLRSILFLLGLYGLYSIIPSGFLSGLFLVASVIVLAFFEAFLGNFSENIILNETLLMAFGFFISFSAANWYFPRYQLLYIVVIFIVTFLLSRSVYEFAPQPLAAKTSSSAVLAFFCSELFWALSFLPFHYSVQGLILFNLFYFCFILNYYYFINTFSYKKVQLHLVLLVFTSLLILLATPWRIIY